MFVSIQNDRADGTLNSWDFHDLILQDITKLLDVCGRDNRYDIKLAGDLVEIDYLVKLRQRLNYIVHSWRVHEYAYERD